MSLGEHNPIIGTVPTGKAALAREVTECLAPARFEPATLTTDHMYRAAQKLALCEAGRRVLGPLVAFLNDALSLDGRNRQAALDLIAGCLFGSRAGSARDAINAHLEGKELP